jgi:hypothetical protein
MTLAAQPLVIIGAPRSGTNMLRDVLAAAPGAATWPCDEINYIWRHGHVRHPSDEFTADMAATPVRRYIRRQFAWVARRYHADIVVEKTCANSLRVPFVDAVLPEARYVFIRRNGVDAVGSALRRWKAPLDPAYLARKARFVPPTDLPYYASRYLWNRIHRVISRERQLAFWGPQLDGMPELLAERPLDEVCALQWQRCVNSARRALATMPHDKWIEITYEDFVRQPAAEMDRVADWLGLDFPDNSRQEAIAGVRADSIGKGRAALDADSLERVERVLTAAADKRGDA